MDECTGEGGWSRGAGCPGGGEAAADLAETLIEHEAVSAVEGGDFGDGATENVEAVEAQYARQFAGFEVKDRIAGSRRCDGCGWTDRRERA